jgi:hypothetical protein
MQSMVTWATVVAKTKMGILGGVPKFVSNWLAKPDKSGQWKQVILIA